MAVRGARAPTGPAAAHIGVLMGFATSDLGAQSFQRAFNQRLRELGWIDGTNATLEYRWGAGSAERFKAYAAELVSLKPDIIVANTTPATAALRAATTTIPIVFVQVTDPVGQGFVTNLAHPGGNATGFDLSDFSVGGKWLELLKEVAPAVTRVAIMYNPQTVPSGYLPSTQSAAASLAVEFTEAPVRDDSEIERAIRTMSERPGGGIIVMADAFMANRRKPIIELAAKHRLPVVYPRRIYVADGGVMGYGTDGSSYSGTRPNTSIGFSRVPIPAGCRFNSQPSTSWRSISKPLRRSASQCHRNCCSPPTR